MHEQRAPGTFRTTSAATGHPMPVSPTFTSTYTPYFAVGRANVRLMREKGGGGQGRNNRSVACIFNATNQTPSFHTQRRARGSERDAREKEENDRLRGRSTVLIYCSNVLNAVCLCPPFVMPRLLNHRNQPTGHHQQNNKSIGFNVKTSPLLCVPGPHSSVPLVYYPPPPPPFA